MISTWQNISETLDAHIRDKISFQSIAEQLHMALSTLRRLVKQHTGYALHDYVHRLKMSEAKKLLVNSDASVMEIAAMLRYEDAYYFSRLFKRYVGVSASAFRQSFRKC